MITGDNPLTAVHVATQVEIVDRQTLIPRRALGRHLGTGPRVAIGGRAGCHSRHGIRAARHQTLRHVRHLHHGVAMKQYQDSPIAWNPAVQNTWVYARVSPSQKEFILNSLKSLGYITLMAGDGTMTSVRSRPPTSCSFY